MRGLLRIAVVATFAALPMVALASSGPGQVWATNCNKEQYKPATIVVTCGDANTYLDKLKWSSWSTTKATGHGDYAYNTCKPNCAAGNIKSFPAAATLSDPKHCTKQKHEAFTKLEVTFTHGRPTGLRATAKFTLGCPF